MNFIQPASRDQLEMVCLQELIRQDNPVRVIDVFVDKLALDKLGFKSQTMNTEGRPAFENNIFLKLYLYGYINSIRSSRRLEKECARNIELHWLLGKLVPNYQTIANFRKDNPKALRNLFKLFVTFLKENELVEGRTLAIDGTKVRAHNSKKNNYNPKKIKRHIDYIEQKSEEYFKQLEHNDTTEQLMQVADVEEKILRLRLQKINYEILAEQLEQSGQPQISTTDTDSRALLVQGQVVEIAYNMQAAVDS